MAGCRDCTLHLFISTGYPSPPAFAVIGRWSGKHPEKPPQITAVFSRNHPPPTVDRVLIQEKVSRVKAHLKCKRAGKIPPSLNIYGLQPQQLLFLRVKFLLGDGAHVQQLLKLFQFIGGRDGLRRTLLRGGLFTCPLFIA